MDLGPVLFSAKARYVLAEARSTVVATGAVVVILRGRRGWFWLIGAASELTTLDASGSILAAADG